MDVNSQEFKDMPPAARLESQWDNVIRALRHVGARYKLGALLRSCREREVADGVITLKFLHPSNMERTQQELENRQSQEQLKDVLSRAIGDAYDVELAVADGANGASNRSAASRSHLVRAAQQMGATVTSEQEVQTP